MKPTAVLALLTIASLLGVSDHAFAFGKAKPTPTPEPTTIPIPAPEPTQPVPIPIAEVTLGEISAGGSGCPGGLLLKEVSFDQLMIRVRFARFVAEVLDDEALDRKNCSIAIPVQQVTEGKRLVVAQTVLKGANNLAAQSNSKVTLETFFAGGATQKLENEFSGAVGIFDLVQTEASQSLACGGTGILRLNASVLVQSFGSTQVNEIIVFLSLLPCSGGN